MANVDLEGRPGTNVVPWIIGLVVLAALVWWLFFRGDAGDVGLLEGIRAVA